jgi:hypothetical protein
VTVQHIREAATPTDLLIEGGKNHHEAGYILGDCSCGGWYYAKAGGDEFAALEAAHQEHVEAMKRVTDAVREFRATARRQPRRSPSPSQGGGTDE